MLDKLGDPEAIVAADAFCAGAVGGSGAREWMAILLLLLGGFIFGIGWVVGLVLPGSSRAWSLLDKLVGTFVIPGGLATAALAGLVAVGSPPCDLTVPTAPIIRRARKDRH